MGREEEQETAFIAGLSFCGVEAHPRLRSDCRLRWSLETVALVDPVLVDSFGIVIDATIGLFVRETQVIDYESGSSHGQITKKSVEIV